MGLKDVAWLVVGIAGFAVALFGGMLLLVLAFEGLAELGVSYDVTATLILVLFVGTILVSTRRKLRRYR